MKFTWLTLAMYALLLQLAPATMAEEAALLPQGIVAKQPETGLFVATEQGFMVPYRVTIPGTQVEFEMVPIPGGRYSMTRHGRTFTVVIEPFWMAKTEVTWAEYRRYMDLAIVFDKFDDLGIRQVTEANEVDAVTAPSKLYEPSFTFESGDDPDQPAVSMTQYSAKQYTKWLSRLTGQFFRLPSEAEWEYACLAGAETSFSFGDDTATLGDYAWYYDNADYELGRRCPEEAQRLGPMRHARQRRRMGARRVRRSRHDSRRGEYRDRCRIDRVARRTVPAGAQRGFLAAGGPGLYSDQPTCDGRRRVAD